jgi:hypothetical protein
MLAATWLFLLAPSLTRPDVSGDMHIWKPCVKPKEKAELSPGVKTGAPTAMLSRDGNEKPEITSVPALTD